MKPKHPLEIIDMDWNHGDTSLLLSKGHHDKEEFLNKASFAYSTIGDNYTVENVKHVYMRSWPDKTREYDRYYMITEKGPGAFPATILECW